MSENETNSITLYMQLAKKTESRILSGEYKNGERIPSSIALAKESSINVATTQRGIHTLINNGILIQKRGTGTCVGDNAYQILYDEHKNQFYQKYVLPLVFEANLIGFTMDDISAFVRSGFAE